MQRKIKGTIIKAEEPKKKYLCYSFTDGYPKFIEVKDEEVAKQHHIDQDDDEVEREWFTIKTDQLTKRTKRAYQQCKNVFIQDEVGSAAVYYRYAQASLYVDMQNWLRRYRLGKEPIEVI